MTRDPTKFLSVGPGPCPTVVHLTRTGEPLEGDSVTIGETRYEWRRALAAELGNVPWPTIPRDPLPHDDASAHAALRQCAGHPGKADTMCGLYDVRRAQGDSVLAAYEAALLASLPPELRPKLGK